jgi:hypothetical protein
VDTEHYASGQAVTILTAADGRQIEVDTISFEDLLMLAGITRRSVRDVFGEAVENTRAAALARPKQAGQPAADGAVKRGPGRPKVAA